MLLDVFTAAPLEGNGLAVVHDADVLDEETMLGFAARRGCRRPRSSR
ncbi:MAG: PhzF family phenazine biosynthesis protein, partial [Actinomycetota bacterium]|nr:PhzF family phenazine biosynthesis protein [Actinomycetota bacterium]